MANEPSPPADAVGSSSSNKRKRGGRPKDSFASLKTAAQAAVKAAREADELALDPKAVLSSIDEAARALEEATPLFASSEKLCQFGKTAAERLYAAASAALLEALELLRQRIKAKELAGKELVQAIEALGKQVETFKLNALDPLRPATTPSAEEEQALSADDEALVDRALEQARRELQEARARNRDS